MPGKLPDEIGLAMELGVEENPAFAARARGSVAPANWKIRVVGVFSILFGLLGALVPVLFVYELQGQGAASATSALLLFVPFVVHAYLAVEGVRLLCGRNDRSLTYYFGVVPVYGLLLFVGLAVAAAFGATTSLEARSASGANVGIFLQLLTGFPLWGWFLLRDRQPARKPPPATY